MYSELFCCTLCCLKKHWTMRYFNILCVCYSHCASGQSYDSYTTGRMYSSLQHRAASSTAGGLSSSHTMPHSMARQSSSGSPKTPSSPLSGGPTSPRDPDSSPGAAAHSSGFPGRARDGSVPSSSSCNEFARQGEGGGPPQQVMSPSESSSQHLPPSANHRRSASTGSALVKGGNKVEGGRKAPPPPPKRSESTRLSGDVPRMVATTPGQKSQQESVYANCEGIVDIEQLPPPPPELLAGLPESAARTARAASSQQRASGKQQKQPPPPPVRSKDTHLTRPH